jgi:hypothetical protein
MSSETVPVQRIHLRPAYIAIIAVAGLLVAGTAVLWAHYGTTVFYETIVAGLANCL